MGRGVYNELSAEDSKFVFCNTKSVTCKVLDGRIEDVIPTTVLTGAISIDEVPTLTTLAKTGFGKEVSVYFTMLYGFKLVELNDGELDLTVLVFKT